MQLNILEMGFIFLSLYISPFDFFPQQEHCNVEQPPGSGASLPAPLHLLPSLNLTGNILNTWPCKHKYSARHSSSLCKKGKLKRWNDTLWAGCKPELIGVLLSKLINPSQVQPTHLKPARNTHREIFFAFFFAKLW